MSACVDLDTEATPKVEYRSSASGEPLPQTAPNLMTGKSGLETQ